ncbi:MAG: hypothetical protein J6C82_04255 [Clostridia bacterium]|nr:hypothetical protein [Clostridia bacterium]
MNYKRICTDFEKRYGGKCEELFFTGKPVIFFSRPAMTVGCSVSVGGCVALAKRSDERLVVQFSDSDAYLSCNKLDFKYNKDKKIIDLLLQAEKYGVKVGGAAILMYYNSELSHPFRPMMLSALSGFCDNAPQPAELIKHFDGFEKNMICVSSRKDTLTIFDGQRLQYAPMPDSQVKIVLCSIKEKSLIKHRAEDGTAADAVTALHRGDIERFGALLNKETELLIKKNKLRSTEKLFKEAVGLKDAYGSGILEDGGIFSVVKNSRVDAFMHNLGTAYEKQFGARPRFYVTRTEESGTRIPVPQS